MTRPARNGWRFAPVTPESWPRLVELFGARGACGGCWCMWPRRAAREYAAGKGAGNRRALRARVGRGVAPGLLAFEGGVPVGWVAIAPRREYVRFERSRVLAPVDAQEVWSVPCFFVARTHRGRGLTRALLDAACAFARRHGARIVEGYPLAPRNRQAAAFGWVGYLGSFVAAGFTEVARRSPTRPIVRRAVRAVRAAAPGPAAGAASTRRG